MQRPCHPTPRRLRSASLVSPERLRGVRVQSARGLEAEVRGSQHRLRCANAGLLGVAQQRTAVLEQGEALLGEKARKWCENNTFHIISTV